MPSSSEGTLFVGVDSGIMHLASSFDIPVLGIFGPADPFYVGPQNTKSRLVRKEELECVPCHLKGCEERECMKRIETGDVFHACEEVLNR
jgi:heptosyltransferase-2